ncbi:CHAD domain-containing protein [Flavobacterium sp. XS2P39]|uniref:CHAD domain-containing protein n=1 Tax=Flavobacterium sp. XS2P39 TaxID=3401725 RepID=UPI003AAF6EAB
MRALKKYLKKRECTINCLLETPQQYYTPETIHTLRVEIKRLNALFNLANYCSKGFKKKKNFKPFKRIFRQAGKVRELQIEQSLLEEYFALDLLPDYKEHLEKLLTGELDFFFIIKSNNLPQILNKKYQKIGPLLTATSTKKATRYVAKKRTEIKKLTAKNPLKDKHLHPLRKQFKEYQYSHNSINYEPQNKPTSSKEILPELLGEWHDHQIIIKHLKEVIESGEINSNESDQLEIIKASFIFKNELLFHKIETTLSATLFRND